MTQLYLYSLTYTKHMKLDPAEFLRQLFKHAVVAVHPDRCLAHHLPLKPDGNILIVGAGKASAAMAQAVEQQWGADVTGIVITPYGHAVACRHIEIIEASHPDPDRAGLEATKRILELTESLSEQTTLLALWSGGGSALFTQPLNGISHQQKQILGHQLLRCGASIDEINCVRKHLSSVKGGRFAQHCLPAKMISLCLSDVPGDDASIIASGPTCADNTSQQDAIAILNRYRISVSDDIQRVLNDPMFESPKLGKLFEDCVSIIARANDAITAATKYAHRIGIDVEVLGDDLQGEAKELGHQHALLAIQHQLQINKPVLLLSGGETTVTVRGNGRGGRNTEYLLSLLTTLKDAPGIWALAADSDGIDGSQDNAGAVIGPESWRQSIRKKLDGFYYLSNNDSYRFFKSLNRLLITGPTLTNVNDIRAIYIEPINPNENGHS